MIIYYCCSIMLLLLLNYVVLRALWKIDVHLISTLVNKSVYYYYYYFIILFLILLLLFLLLLLLLLLSLLLSLLLLLYDVPVHVRILCSLWKHGITFQSLYILQYKRNYLCSNFNTNEDYLFYLVMFWLIVVYSKHVSPFMFPICFC